MYGRWRWDGQHRGLIVQISERDFSRVGNCWMHGRLKEGDLAMCVVLAGDCFWDYVLVRPNISHIQSYVGPTGKQVYKAILGSRFGAYTLGTPHTWQPTERQFHWLMAGESVESNET